MSQNPLFHLPLALHHPPTLVTLRRRTHLPPLPRDTRHIHLEIGWDLLLPSTPTRVSLSMGLWPLPMVFMLPSMTAGEYGGLR